MAIYKCKMCGGSLEVSGESSVATCEYCGSVQTLPKKNDEVITNLFNRANNLRIKCEFDKAAEVYEKILNEDNNDSEAHWGLVLCKYGIEYVEDPKTYKRIPTCHRTQYESILTDVDYLAAISNADSVSADIYKAQAEEIANLQKDILAIVKNEKPFDVFICYKETDENGKRTVDSTLANDIYYQLTQEGMKVFYAAITLEDKLGVEYEPYIFAALNSAKVMLVVGTKPEYFETVWVKNEWSRYLKLMKNDRSKLLVPCYRDMDAYDLPEEFSHLQAQDMSKIGFVNDVVRGIKKVITSTESKTETVVKETVVTSSNTSTAPLLKRAFMFLEDGDWKSADEYCEKVLDIDPECAEAYLGKLMLSLKVNKREELKNCSQPFDDKNYYQKAIRFADDALKKELEGYIESIRYRIFDEAYKSAQNLMSSAKTELEFKNAASKFNEIKNFKDSEKLALECLKKAEETRLEAEQRAKENRLSYLYDCSVSEMESATTSKEFKKVAEKFKALKNYEDSESNVQLCLRKAEELRLEEERIAEEERLEAERRAEELRLEEERLAEEKRIADEKAKLEAEARKKKNKIIKAVVMSIVAVVLTVVIIFATVIIPNGKYDDAVALMEAGKYQEAISAFEALGGHKDSADKIKECNTAVSDIRYNEATSLLSEKNYEEAIAIFEALDGYKDSNDKITQANYEYALLLIKQGNHNEAYKKLLAVSDYKDAKKYLEKFCALPVKIISECNSTDAIFTYSFSYNKDGMISEVVSDRFGNNVYSFDKNGRVIKANHYHDSYSTNTTYTYKNDGTILVELFNKNGGKSGSNLYNSYGNRIAYYNTNKEWVNIDYNTYDEFNNRNNHVENTYDENNNLLSVYYKMNRYWSKSTIEYEYLYFENGEPDKDLLWRNIRIICEETFY